MTKFLRTINIRGGKKVNERKKENNSHQFYTHTHIEYTHKSDINIDVDQ